MLLFNYHSGFKQEMFATSIMISLGVLGSFLLLSQFGPNSQNKSNVLGIQSLEIAQSNPNSTTSDTTTTDNPTTQPPQTNIQNQITKEASSSPKPTPPPSLELPYGSSQEFDTPEFKLTFTKPRLLVTTSRVFKVDVVLGNKSISEGFENVLYGTIVDNDDKIVSPRVPLNLTEKKKINQGEQLTFSASLSIPETMKLSQISFDAKNNGNDTLYLLDPTL